MVKAKTLFIWEGPHMITITRGYQLEREANCVDRFCTKVKGRGLFKQFIDIRNINEIFVGSSKKLCLGDKTLDGWEVIRIRKDFKTHDPYIPDIPPSILLNLKSLRNELELWKRKYHDARKLNEDREQKDRLRKRVEDDADHMAKVKNKFFSQDSWGGGFASRWSLPPPSSGGSEE